MTNEYRKYYIKVFHQYYSALCNFAFTFINNSKDAQDLVQDVFAHFWENQTPLPPPEKVKNFLIVAVKNKSLEYIRKKNKQQQLLVKIHESDIQKMVYNLDMFVLRGHLNNSLRHLPPKCRKVFELNKFSGLTYAEIASELNISTKSVKNHISKAYKKLRLELKSIINKNEFL